MEKNVRFKKKMRIYSALEVANICGVVNQTAINWIRNNHLKAFVTPGGQYRVYHDELVNFMQERGMRIPKALLGTGDSLIIVDDDKSFNNALSTFLKKELKNFTIYQSFDGFDAGLKIMKHKPSIVFLDLDLPGVAGKEICFKIKQDIAYNNPFVVVITGLEGNAVEAELKEKGADLILKKPIDFASMLEQVKSFIETENQKQSVL
ncbi:MAG: response regulator [Treponema sp.]